MLALIGFNLVMIGACLMPPYLWRDEGEAKKLPAPLPAQSGKRRKDKRRVPVDAVTTPSPVYR